MASQSNVVQMPKPEAEGVTLTQAQHRIGVKRQAIERMIAEKYINPRKIGRKYDFDSLCWEIIRYYRGEASGKTQNEIKHEIEMFKMREQARKLKIANDKEEGLLIAVNIHQRAINEIAIAVLDIFDKIGAELPQLLAETPDQEHEFFPIIERWVNKARQRLAENFRERGED